MKRSWLLFMVALPLAAVAQTATVAGRGRATERPTTTPPVSVRLWGEKARMDATLVGRTSTHLILAPAADEPRQPVPMAELAGVTFNLNYNRFEVMRALHDNDWATAIRLQFAAFEPTFPYLDLPNNNAADGAFELGNIMMKAAQRTLFEAQNSDEVARAKRQFESAYNVYSHCMKVEWSSIGLLAQLKGYRCLIAMGRSRTAWLQLAKLEEPVVGDAAYGHYWLAQAELHMATNGFAGAMDASVKSLCFENKDVETFPDALLISARCYEAFEEFYRARDVYFEVAKLFPDTDWSRQATERLRAIMAQGLTAAQEEVTVEHIFMSGDEDMNGLVEAFLKRAGEKKLEFGGEQESEVIDHNAP